MSTAAQQKLAWLLAAIVLALAFAISSPDFADAQDGAQRWEYAGFIYSGDEGVGFAFTGDLEENNEINEEMSDLAEADDLNVIAGMNILGGRGWELVTMQGSGASTIYFFKRPLP